MIKVNFNPDKLPAAKKNEWTQLLALAGEGTARLIDEWEDFVEKTAKWRANPEGERPVFEPKFDDTLWKKIRDWLLLNVFHDKCGYCETPILRFVGDAEHFRPKGRVSIPLKDGKRKTGPVSILAEDGSEMRHPGYFWLAYNWKNLLPACQLCNRNGKRDLFPVGKSHFAAGRLNPEDAAKLRFPNTSVGRMAEMFYLDPEDLDELEGRLLLHPYFDAPAAHLIFGTDGGVKARDNSPIGEISIELYKLRERNLDRARGMAQSTFFLTYMSTIGTTPGNVAAKTKAAKKVILDYIRDGRPYVLAILDYIHENLNSSPYDLRDEFLN